MILRQRELHRGTSSKVSVQGFPLNNFQCFNKNGFIQAAYIHICSLFVIRPMCSAIVSNCSHSTMCIGRCTQCPITAILMVLKITEHCFFSFTSSSVVPTANCTRYYIHVQICISLILLQKRLCTNFIFHQLCLEIKKLFLFGGNVCQIYVLDSSGKFHCQNIPLMYA